MTSEAMIKKIWLLTILFGSVIIIALILFLVLTRHDREQNVDSKTIERIVVMVRQNDNYYQQYHKLPEPTTEEPIVNYNTPIIKYSIKSETNYQLCSYFFLPSPSLNSNIFFDARWKHGVGQHCFEFNATKPYLGLPAVAY